MRINYNYNISLFLNIYVCILLTLFWKKLNLIMNEADILPDNAKSQVV